MARFGRAKGTAWSAIALVALLTSCAHGKPAEGSTPQVEPALGPVPVVQDTTTLVLPLDSYLPDQEETTAITRARDVLLTECMARYGFRYHNPENANPGVSQGHSRIYGVTDLATAQRYGFHPPPAARNPLVYPADSDLTGQKEAVFSGTVGRFDGRTVPKGGCSGEVDRAIHKNTDITLRTAIPEELQLQASDEAQADSRVRAVFDKWSACMKSHGYSYTDPPALLRDGSVIGKQPTQAEISTAVADVTCKRQNNVVGVWSTVETAYERRLVDKNATVLAEIRSSWSTQAKNAEALVTGQKNQESHG